jgi:hypothetical protein
MENEEDHGAVAEKRKSIFQRKNDKKKATYSQLNVDNFRKRRQSVSSRSDSLKTDIINEKTSTY